MSHNIPNYIHRPGEVGTMRYCENLNGLSNSPIGIRFKGESSLKIISTLILKDPGTHKMYLEFSKFMQ